MYAFNPHNKSEIDTIVSSYIEKEVEAWKD